MYTMKLDWQNSRICGFAENLKVSTFHCAYMLLQSISANICFLDFETINIGEFKKEKLWVDLCDILHPWSNATKKLRYQSDYSAVEGGDLLGLDLYNTFLDLNKVFSDLTSFISTCALDFILFLIRNKTDFRAFLELKTGLFIHVFGFAVSASCERI